ncbi:MAG: M3 family oligoendopeptidase [Chloroflexi bacterium]|nr:M3 family oligoendopeptidase [Chloroflexota bacterium]
MFDSLPKTGLGALDWQWAQYEPYVQDLLARSLSAAAVNQWMQDWTKLYDLINDVYNRLAVQHTLDTTDEVAEKRYMAFLENIYPPATMAEQKLKEKLLASGLEPQGCALPLKKMRVAAEIFREANVALEVEENKLVVEFDKIIGAQTVLWNGEEMTVEQLLPFFEDPDRSVREKAWRLRMERKLQDRQTLNALWAKFLQLRIQMAKNAGEPDYRALRWKQFKRFDYTPQDCETFHAAIEAAVVPAVQRLNAKRRQQTGLAALRPWDFGFDVHGRAPLRPFEDVTDLDARCEVIFNQVDAALGKHFAHMRQHKLLDLPNRKSKAPGGYCTSYPAERVPFIFMNAVGIHDDVQTLLHEAGHAFHVYETNHLPYYQQTDYTMEMAEVASMAMELLAAPYLTQDKGGFYTPQDAARARLDHLENMLVFWPYMAVVDAFQHWVYTHPQDALDTANCDAKWGELWSRFKPGVDWSGLEDIRVTGWQRKLHIFQVPFYYVDYGLAQMGAAQVWGNALHDQAGAVAAYRRALALGGTVGIPEFFQAAGARFAFDTATMQQVVDLIETQMDKLEQIH